MIGDPLDMRARLRSALPPSWFPDQAPVLDLVLSGLAGAASRLYDLLAAIRAQTRLATATHGFLDLAAADFFGLRLRRRALEADTPFRARIERALTRTRATRAALTAALLDLTGAAPTIFEPARPADTGAWSTSALSWNTAGGWGSLALPFQSFVTVIRPRDQGIAVLGGYGTPGPRAYASLADIAGRVTDADIYAEVAATLPASAIAWTRITD